MTLTASRVRLRMAFVAGVAAMSASALAVSTAIALPEPVANPPPTSTAGALTVTAPRVVRHHAGPAWAMGAPIEVVSLSKSVSFVDLDLATDAGVTEFRKRILYASLDACNQLEAQYPSNRYVLVPANQNCPDTTATAALAVAKEIVQAARIRAEVCCATPGRNASRRSKREPN